MNLSLFSQRVPSGIFSECFSHPECVDPYCIGRPYRYVLKLPTGIDNDRVALACLANPSTAIPVLDKLDPTMKRWRKYCRDWGFGWAWTVNVRAWRQTKTELLPDDPVAIGPHNVHWIATCVMEAELVVCGWGEFGGQLGVDMLQTIRAYGKVPHALKLNSTGSPTHPLYLKADLKPFPIP